MDERGKCRASARPTAGAGPAYSRRAVLRAVLGAAGLAGLAACGGGSATPTTGGGGQATVAGVATAPATAAGAGATRATTTGAETRAVITATRATTPAGTAPVGRATAARSPVASDGRIRAEAADVPDAYTRRPPAFQSVKEVPGRGGTVSTFQFIAVPPPTGKAENRYWQELEKRLGVTLEPTLAPVGSANERLAALTAGGTLPDLVWLQLGVTPDQNRVIQQGGYTDLTPYLSGDALREYPNLAAFPEYLWQNVRINGKIYGVPAGSLLVTETHFYRRDWGEKVGIPRPRNADELLQMLLAFTKQDPDGNSAPDTWGMASQMGRIRTDIFEYMFRVPNDWRRNSDGSLTNAVETEEFKGAVALARRCWEAGVFHPDSVSLTNPQTQDLAYAGRVGSFPGGLGALSNHRKGTRQHTPTANVLPLTPAGHDGGTGGTHKGPGFVRFTAISARAGRDRERVKELLRILDWYAAPFGSEENNFKDFGLAGVHHTVKPNGALERTPAGDREISALPLLAIHPLVFYDPDSPDEAVLLQNATAEMVKLGIDDPTQGIYSAAEASRAGQLSRLRDDRIIAVVTGREPLSALDGFVREWRSRGGDEIRKEYEQGLKEQR